MMQKMLCLLLCLLLPVLATAEAPVTYQGDGMGMYTVLTETNCYRWPDEEHPLTQLPEGARVIAVSGNSLSDDSKEQWRCIYVPGYGYGYAEDTCLRLEAPRLVGYHPGFGVSAALFIVEDAEQVRVEIISLDNLEFPVIKLQRIFTQEKDGCDEILAAFTTAGDVCKTTRERLCATLYDLAGEPLEVMVLEFDAPNWR